MGYPGEDRVRRFLDGYKEQFNASLLGGQGVAKAQETTVAGTPMSPDQAKLEKIKLENAALESRDRLVHPDTLKIIMGDKAIPAHTPGLGTPASDFSNSSEGRILMDRNATPIPHVSGGFNPALTTTDLAGFPNQLSRGGAIEMAKVGPDRFAPAGISEEAAAFRKDQAIPTGTTYFQYTTPDGRTGYTDREENIPPGSRAITRSFEDTGNVAFGGGGGGGGYAGSPVPMALTGTPQFQVPGEIQQNMSDIQRILMKPTERPMGYTDRGWQPIGKEGGYSKHKLSQLGEMAKTWGTLAHTGAGFDAKMAELGAEAPGRAALADYYSRMAGVHEQAIPWENYARAGAGAHAFSEANKGPVMGPGYSMRIGDNWITAPEKKEPIHPIVQRAMTDSFSTDATGAKLGFNEPEFRGRLRALWSSGALPRGEIKPEYLAMPRAEWILTAKSVDKSNKRKFGEEHYNKQYQEYVKRFM